MPWFKVDDALALHMKAITAGNAALGLWVRAGSWSMQQLSDGFIPHQVVAALGGTDDDCGALVTARLWDTAPGGYQFHDWAEYQPTREQVLAERAEAAERMRRVRANRKANVRANAQPNEPRTFGDGSASPSRPVPTPDSSKTSEGQSRKKRASDETDSKLSPTLTRVATNLGLLNVAEIRNHIVAWCQRDLALEDTIAVARWVLEKRATAPDKPQRYVMRAIEQSPLEVQQHIDQRGLAA